MQSQERGGSKSMLYRQGRQVFYLQFAKNQLSNRLQQKVLGEMQSSMYVAAVRK